MKTLPCPPSVRRKMGEKGGDSLKTLTVAETAEKLKVSTSTVYAMTRKKQIPHFRIGQKIFFRDDALEKWITHLEVGTES
ncbi:helix-turn-helix domain-containing protein [Paenibacillus algicola]|uniref:helix-turn-helix domain-containing protein n=1 Tax=Paenibacillus algicola TaxID=2565926 RepID=UPI0026B8F6EB|nr:helix-turn-helix domain-containing protein [Paenibacillus algicola]